MQEPEEHTQPPPPITSNSEDRPKLWNPNAAANWCIIFTPIFGSFLIARNWKELNQTQKSKNSMVWFYASIVTTLTLVCLIGFTTYAPLFRALPLLFLVIWYYVCAKKQVKFIKVNQINYEKKSWGKPLLFGIAGHVIAFIVTFILFMVFAFSNVIDLPNEVIEESSIPAVTQILHTQLDRNANCNSVTITEEISSGVYNAIANLDDGTELKITINVKGMQLYINVPPQ